MHIRNDEDFVLRTRLPESPVSLRGVKCTQNTVNRNVFSFFLLCLVYLSLFCTLKKKTDFLIERQRNWFQPFFTQKKEIQKNKRNAKCAQYFRKDINKTPDNVAGMSSRSGASSCRGYWRYAGKCKKSWKMMLGIMHNFPLVCAPNKKERNPRQAAPSSTHPVETM